MSNVQNYEYLPLEAPADYIRLLKLVSPAACPDHGNCVWGELVTYRRHEAPDYRPVSYTWGQQHASSTLYLKEGDVNCNRQRPAMATQKSQDIVRQSSQDAGICSVLDSCSREPDSICTEDKPTTWRKFSIRPNLEALLRLLSGFPGSTLFWVDAICINQNDNYEKGLQVRNMDKIYKDKELLIWLGQPTDNSDIAINLIQDLQRLHGELPSNSTENSGGIRLKASSSPAAIQALTRILQEDISNWKAFHDLIRRPWFTRRWIVQEFVLSKHKDVYVGSRVFPFEYIMGLIFLVHQFPNSLHLSKDEHEDNTCRQFTDRSEPYQHRFLAPVLDPVDNIDRLWEAYEASKNGETDAFTLEKLLDKFASFQSYDPRDGIYAFLSMASDMEGVDWIPDYSNNNTVTNLYSQAVLHIIRSSHSLDIICHRIHNFEFAETVSHLSRWVPWFGTQEVEYGPGHSHSIHGYNTKSLTTFGQPLRTLREGQAGYFASRKCGKCDAKHGSRTCDECDLLIDGTGFKCLDCPDFDYCHRCISKSESRHDATHQFEIYNKAIYFASSYLTISIGDPNQAFDRIATPSGDLPLLHSRGYLVDSIRGVGQPGMISRNASGATFQLPMGKWLDLPGMKERGLDSNGQLGYNFVRALTGNRKIVDGRVCHIPDDDLDILQQKLKPDTCSEIGEDNHPWKQLSNSIFFMLSNSRRFATTEKSLGFAPDGTVVGDRIAILVGCSVPVVIGEMKASESRTLWVLKGECYIDGFMEGEMWATVGHPQPSMQTLTLV